MQPSRPVAVGVDDQPAPAGRQAAVPGPITAPGRWLRAHVTDEWLVTIVAAALSVGFFIWYDRHGLTLAFNDARIRELIARRVVVSRTPGLAQFGTTWLPFSFMLMLPLIWDGTLFRDGIAGSLPSMAAFVIAAVYMYRAGRLATSSRWAGWVAAGTLMAVPSLLYIQSTAMSETASLAALVVTVYYALKVAQSYYALDLVKCAAAAVAGTLIRYENWLIAIALVPVFVYIAWRRHGYVLAESWALLYSLLAFVGCAAWVLYNGVIFHDPLLSFFYGNSSNSFGSTSAALYPARHHPLYALGLYGVTVGYTVGWAVAILAIAGLAVFVWRRGLLRRTLPVYVTLVPLGFYWLVLFLGANRETLPQFGGGQYYNVRFGLLMIPAVAIFAAFVTTIGSPLTRRLLAAGVLAVVVGSAVLGFAQAPLVLREARYGPAGAPSATSGAADAAWLGSRYHGGNILITYVNSPSMIFYLLTRDKVPDDALITDANGSQFTEALAAPQDWVQWIVMDSDASNGSSQIWTTLHRNTAWHKYFVLRKTLGTAQIYSRRAPA